MNAIQVVTKDGTRHDIPDAFRIEMQLDGQTLRLAVMPSEIRAFFLNWRESRPTSFREDEGSLDTLVIKRASKTVP